MQNLTTLKASGTTDAMIGLKGKVYLVEEIALEKLQIFSGGSMTADFVRLVTDHISDNSMLDKAK